MRKFYKDLYSSRNCNVDTSLLLLNDQNIKQLKEENKVLCKKPIAESEAKLVKVFWNDIGDYL